MPTPPAAAWKRIVWPFPTLKVWRSRNCAVSPFNVIAAAVRKSIAFGKLDQPVGRDQPLLGSRSPAGR